MGFDPESMARTITLMLVAAFATVAVIGFVLGAILF